MSLLNLARKRVSDLSAAEYFKCQRESNQGNAIAAGGYDAENAKPFQTTIPTNANQRYTLNPGHYSYTWGVGIPQVVALVGATGISSISQGESFFPIVPWVGFGSGNIVPGQKVYFDVLNSVEIVNQFLGVVTYNYWPLSIISPYRLPIPCFKITTGQLTSDEVSLQTDLFGNHKIHAMFQAGNPASYTGVLPFLLNTIENNTLGIKDNLFQVNASLVSTNINLYLQSNVVR